MLVGGWLVFATPGQADKDQSALASLNLGLLTTPTTGVSIGDIDGALSSTGRGLRISHISDEAKAPVAIWIGSKSLRLDAAPRCCGGVCR